MKSEPNSLEKVDKSKELSSTIFFVISHISEIYAVIFRKKIIQEAELVLTTY